MGTNVDTIKTRPTITNAAPNEDDYTSKIPNKVKLLASMFASHLQGKIAKISDIKFRLLNLWKLRHM